MLLTCRCLSQTPALAVDQANANHTIPGYTLVFEPKDDVGPRGVNDPAVGVHSVTALVADALVAGIVGPFNRKVVMAELTITNQAPLAQISPATSNPCLTKETAEWGCSGFIKQFLIEEGSTTMSPTAVSLRRAHAPK